jgi:hypothetical protein
MKTTMPLSFVLVAGCVGAFLVLGAGCGKTADGGGEGTAGGGGADSGGTTGGEGGSSGSGGSRVIGSGGSTTSSGGGGAGGRASGGVTGSGGVVGSGGTTAVADAAVAGARDARLRPDLNVPTDTAPEASAAQPDTNTSIGDGDCVPDYSCNPVSPNTGDPYADCVARVNQFRACVCLPPLAQWTAGQACADQDAQYDSQQGTAHAGAQANICDWGSAQNECPSWSRATPESVIDGCLQMMFEEGPPPSSPCTGSCYTAHGHYINMTGTNYRYGVACGFYTTSSGAVWAVQNFK